MDGLITFSTMHDLPGCIQGCKKLDDIRRGLSDPAYAECIKLCSGAVLLLCRIDNVDERITCHALILAQHFISTETPVKDMGPDLIYYWVCVGVVCYTLSIKFNETWEPMLENTLHAVGMSDSLRARKYYIRIQSRVLNAIKWTLFFPTAIDILDRTDTYKHFQALSMVAEGPVKFIICFCYNEPDMLPYSSHCLAISALATAVRYKTRSASFDGIFCLLSVMDDMEDEVASCSEAMYSKMQMFPYFLAAA